jgi:hydrogenase maturation protein HypF
LDDAVHKAVREVLISGDGSVHRTLRLIVGGQVQGVGFRPFVYRLARRLDLGGTVRNCMGEVEILLEGSEDRLARFRHDLIDTAPPLAEPRIVSVAEIEPQDFRGFGIEDSLEDSAANICLPPDYFMCDDCRNEQQDPADRRYRYPFINCTQCGPRYTLIERLPYDRANTSMSGFPLCAACQTEYLDPLDRRFHAEPLACPACGPALSFAVAGEAVAATGEAALQRAVESLGAGQVIAVRGIGGYHLMCDARNGQAVATLRKRKDRPDKPLAVMLPLAGSDGLDVAREIALLDPAEEEGLISPMRPIVLCRKRPGGLLASGIAPGLDELGLFLPYSPLHQLLLDDFGGPLVATSGNLSGEPVLTDVAEAGRRLGAIADAFLHHNRPIVRPADDSVFRRIDGRLRPLRIGRGAAPRELNLPWSQAVPVLAVGGHMKGNIALSWDDRVVVSPHIGEMDNLRSIAVFEQLSADLQRLYKVRAERIACDAHAGYATHRWARQQRDLPYTAVWHHRAHATALVAEHPGGGNWLVFTWDGVGMGEDGTLWGGEALYGTPGQWQRLASLRPFNLPGGERAGREPWRSAAAMSWACDSHWREFPDSQGLAYFAWQRRLNSPASSAAGRLFDAAAYLVCGTTSTSFEAQGPMQLEALCRQVGDSIALPLEIDADGIARSDWQPLMERMADASITQEQRAETFHSSMAQLVLAQARYVREQRPVDRVGLTGGVFQNRALCEQAMGLLRADGFEVRIATELPCNDAALSFGQAAELAAQNALSEDERHADG